MDRLADPVDDGSHVLEIALDLILMPAWIALAAATPNRIHGEVLGKSREDQLPGAMAIPAAVNEEFVHSPSLVA
jgi:hypothetical protein